MRRRLICCIWLVCSVVLSAGTTTASTPAACAQASCHYLPLVSIPQLVALENVGLRGTRFGGTSIEGEVITTTSTSVYSVTLEVRTYDRQGNLLATATGSPLLTATLPAQPNPFVFDTGVDPIDQIDRYDIRVTSYSRAHPRTFLAVEVTVTSYIYEDDRVYLAGTLTNGHSVALEDIRGVPWTEMGGQREVWILASHMAPFETVPFTMAINVPGYMDGTVFPYKISVQGIVAD